MQYYKGVYIIQGCWEFGPASHAGAVMFPCSAECQTVLGHVNQKPAVP